MKRMQDMKKEKAVFMLFMPFMVLLPFCSRYLLAMDTIPEECVQLTHI